MGNTRLRDDGRHTHHSIADVVDRAGHKGRGAGLRGDGRAVLGREVQGRAVVSVQWGERCRQLIEIIPEETVIL